MDSPEPFEASSKLSPVPAEKLPKSTFRKKLDWKAFFIALVVIIVMDWLALSLLKNEEKQKTTQSANTKPSPIPDQTAKWKTYINKEIGISFKYPPFYNQTNTYTLSYEESTIRVVPKSTPFKYYSYMDLSGSNYKFDLDKKVWVSSTSAGKSGLQKANALIEAYVASGGDGNCGFETIIIPNPSYSSVIELINTTCAAFDKKTNAFVPPSFTLPSEKLLSTFKFTQ